MELYKRVAESKDNKVTHSESHINATTVTNENQTCNHRCCAELSEKMQENRIRLLETQMQQNLYINNSMHIQLVAQMQQCQAAMQQKFVERPYPTNHTYPHGNQGNWYGMPPVGHTPPLLPFPHIPPPPPHIRSNVIPTESTSAIYWLSTPEHGQGASTYISTCDCRCFELVTTHSAGHTPRWNPKTAPSANQS